MSTKVSIPGALTLVTGAGSGIGRATAVAFARRGANVLCCDINPETAEQTANACRTLGTDAVGYELDVANREAVAKAADEITAEHGPLDVLVNNAGVGLSGLFMDTEPGDWDWLLGVNLHGVLSCTYSFGPAMLQRRRGHVVNVASGLAYFYRPTEVAYVTSKAAVLAFSRSLRLDWSRHGIGVTAVCPGIINTPIVRNSRMRGHTATPEAAAKTARLFAKRGRPPEQVAAAIVRAVERNRPVAPVGIESWLALLSSRLLPATAADSFTTLSERLTSVEPA